MTGARPSSGLCGLIRSNAKHLTLSLIHISKADEIYKELAAITDQSELMKRFAELKEEYFEDTGCLLYTSEERSIRRAVQSTVLG